ncbi:TonB-dependent receptor [Chitinophaga japonensis]
MILLAPAAVLLGAWSFQDGEEKVTVKGQDVPLLTVFKSIKKQAGYNFFYAANFVNDKERVSVDMQNARVDDVLRKVLGHDYTWVYNENAVSITKKKEEVKRSEAPAAPVKDSSVNQITVSGSVTDAKGAPIPGATVMVKGTHDGASTDENGHFSLAGVRPNAVLVISSVGFEKREIPVKGKTILAKLNVSVNDLDETVVVAYGETTQRANTGAVTVVRGEQIQNLPNRSFDKSLQGMVPGLQITNGTGQPGGGVGNIVLRGIATGGELVDGTTVRNPLIVIDGIPVSQDPIQIRISGTAISNPLSQLNPSDIETITVLKDAAAIALYGSKASNGVILVTTKRGKSGKTVFSFRHQTDIASRWKGEMQVLDRQEYLDLLYETYRNTDPARWTDDAIRADLQQKFPVQANGDFYPAPNWYSELYTGDATTVTNEISMSGGSDRNNFYLNVEHSDQKGIIRRTGYKRTSLRFNFENRASDWLKFGINTTFSYNRQDYSNTSDAFQTNGIAEVMSPLNPVRLADGNYMLNYEWGTSSAIPLANPLAAAEYNINRNTSYRGLAKLYGEVGFLKYLRFTSNVGVDFMLTESKEKVDPRLFDPVNYSTGVGRVEEMDLRNANIINTNILRFDRQINEKHIINILLGQEAQVLNRKHLLVSVKGLGLPYYDQINSPGATVQRYGGVSTRETLLSFFGQANYAFRDRYFISSSLRRDGSSRFGDRKRFGTYWSAGLGWLITSEPFMKQVPWLSYLKIRGSIGAAGNSAAIDRLTRYDILEISTFQGNVAVYPGTSPGNPDVRWEETFTWDAGLEARFLQDRIIVAADIYKRNTSDLISRINLPQSSGYYSVLSNIGNIENSGVELSLSADIIRNGTFRWNVSANWSANQNKLTKANVPSAATVNNKMANEVGRNYNSFYLKKWAGVNPADGLPTWIDSTGKTTSDYNAAIREFVGKPQPDGFGAVTSTLNFGNLELSAMFYYQYGFQVFNSALANPLLTDGRYPYANQVKQALDRWQKPGDIASNPRRMLNNTDGGDRFSTRYLFDGDYIRLKNITLSYTFPGNMLGWSGLSSLRVYVQGNNLALWTKFPGQDPDNSDLTGSTFYAYPSQRSFSGGLNVNF